MLRPVELAKNRYRIPLDILGNIDLSKVRDKTKIYQPFKKASQLVQKFDGKEGRRLLSVDDVDCAATGIDKEQEITFQWDSQNNLVKDKLNDSFIGGIETK